MRVRGLALWGALLGSGAALSGCVAAAIPLVAGGAMVVRGDSKDDSEAAVAGAEAGAEAETAAIARVDIPVETAVPAASARSQPAPEPVGELPSLAGQPAPEGEPRSDPAQPGSTFDAAFADRAPVPDATSARAAPVRTPTTPGPREPLSLRAYDALYAYVDAQAKRDPVEQPRDSALLSSPGLLRPDRTECSIRPPAVVIDLDPAEANFDPTVTPARNTMLGQMLGAMRQQEIAVYWISGLPAVEAGAVRRALGAAGLDPDGKDQLLLMRNGEDRKQERRRELARSHCIVAIAGDTRADFDELFAFLRDRSAAQPLEELVGAGWFLTPLPIEQGQ